MTSSPPRVLVTGAASGIGAAVATRFAGSGAQVWLADIDVASPESWRLLVECCLGEGGPPDYVHLNAGIMSVPPGEPFVRLEDLPLERYRRIVGINLDGVVFGLQALLPHLRGRSGAIAITPSAMQDGRFPIMAPDVMAREVVDLLANGENGEIRLRVSERQRACAIEAPALTYD